MRGFAEVLLVAGFFYNYGAPVFDPLRPGFLDAPLAEFRVAVATVSDGRQVGLDKPLIDVLRPVQTAINKTFEPIAQSNRHHLASLR